MSKGMLPIGGWDEQGHATYENILDKQFCLTMACTFTHNVK